jgi:hypothetical protein
VAAGTYETTVPANSTGCYWEREKSLDGLVDSVIADDTLPAGAHGLVKIEPTDKGVKSLDCGTWTATDASGGSPATSFGDGTFQVGSDVAAGMYETTVPTHSAGCYWETEKSLGGSLSSVIADDNLDPGAAGVVQIAATDKGFTSRNCGIWRRAD